DLPRTSKEFPGQVGEGALDHVSHLLLARKRWRRVITAVGQGRHDAIKDEALESEKSNFHEELRLDPLLRLLHRIRPCIGVRFPNGVPKPDKDLKARIRVVPEVAERPC